jgi:diacylglycerol kinase
MFLSKRIKSFKYAFKGIVTLFLTQPNAKIHAFIAVSAITLAFVFQFSLLKWILLSLTITMVLAAEAFNTSLEFLTDLVSPDYHPLAGKAKDVAAAAVLITAIGAVVVGFCLFLPPILEWIKQF